MLLLSPCDCAYQITDLRYNTKVIIGNAKHAVERRHRFRLARPLDRLTHAALRAFRYASCATILRAATGDLALRMALAAWRGKDLLVGVGCLG